MLSECLRPREMFTPRPWGSVTNTDLYQRHPRHLWRRTNWLIWRLLLAWIRLRCRAWRDHRWSRRSSLWRSIASLTVVMTRIHWARHLPPGKIKNIAPNKIGSHHYFISISSIRPSSVAMSSLSDKSMRSASVSPSPAHEFGAIPTPKIVVRFNFWLIISKKQTMHWMLYNVFVGLRDVESLFSQALLLLPELKSS